MITVSESVVVILFGKLATIYGCMPLVIAVILGASVQAIA
jgi:hypothetical protein